MEKHWRLSLGKTGTSSLTDCNFFVFTIVNVKARFKIADICTDLLFAFVTQTSNSMPWSTEKQRKMSWFHRRAFLTCRLPEL